MRKLKLDQNNRSRKYKKWDIVEEFADVSSELYAPLMRNGEDPKRRHFQIDHTGEKYKAQYEGDLSVEGNRFGIIAVSRCGKYECVAALVG